MKYLKEEEKLREKAVKEAASRVKAGERAAKKELKEAGIRVLAVSFETIESARMYLQENVLGKDIIVLGGGDSAMDCARSALRQGATEVTIAYRGNEQAMRATPAEKQAAWEEGVRLRLEYAPTHILGDESVTGVRFDKVVSGQETIDCDAVIFAVGQVNRPQRWMTRLGIETDRQGILVVNEKGRTSNPKIYAGGDNTLGPDLVVTAVAAGRRAASGILDSFRPARRVQESIGSLLRSAASRPGPGLAAAKTIQ